jgi:serine/threonine protein kinase
VAAGTTGTLLGDRYRVVRRLGSGGMASVYLAEDERLGRKVAVKRLHAESADDMARRFVREAKVGASLNHPNIVSVYDTVTDDEGVLIVMEYVEGETLRDAIARGPLEPERALTILRGIGSALDHAHESGVVHRDVKPANILIAPDGRAKLADLGIASAAERTRITHSGTVLGTAAYMAPERLDGGGGDAAADIYALAVVAFEALTGQKAMQGSTPVEIARRIVSQPPPDLSELMAGATPEAAHVLRRGMAKNPEERPRSARELIDDLSNGLRPPPLAPRHVAHVPAPGGRPRWILPVLALAAIVLVLVIVLGTSGGSDKKQASSGGSASTAPKKHHKRKASQSATPAPAAPAPAAAAGDPGKTLTDFYASSAGGNIDHAWSISTPRLHNQVGGYNAFKNGESDVSSFDFKNVAVTSNTGNAATVSFADDAHHAAYTDHCTGTGDLVRGSSGWLLDRIAVNCGRDGGAPPAGGPPGKAKGKKAKPGKGEGGD